MRSEQSKQKKLKESELPFRRHLLAALEHFTDAVWLGQHSPLATPYFLGEHLIPQTSNGVKKQGETLQTLLRESAATISHNDHYLYRLLDVSFFQPRPLPQILSELGVSKATYYRSGHRPRAIQELETAFVRSIRPSLRLDQPPTPHIPLIDRSKLFLVAKSALWQRQSVALIGSEGTGKTTLASQIAQAWQQEKKQHPFWYIIRSGLNDHGSAALFAIGYFLHKRGASRLWLQLTVEYDTLTYEILLGLLRSDLDQLNRQDLLFCFDSVERLDPMSNDDHMQFVELLAFLTEHAPVLFIGRQCPLTISTTVAVGSWSLNESRQFLHQFRKSSAVDSSTALHEQTQGNPRLIQLLLTLVECDPSEGFALEHLGNTPPLHALFDQIWQRLRTEEQTLLAKLSAFRMPAPLDVFDLESVDALLPRALIQLLPGGAISVLPIYQRSIQRLLSKEELKACHLNAAQVRAERGELTAAAYHYIAGGQTNFAIWQWYQHRQQEIDQGQGIVARQLFDSLSVATLDASEQEILALIRSELRLLIADYAGCKRAIDSTLWQTPALEQRSWQLMGDVDVEQSQFDEAIRAYRKGIDSIVDARTEMIELYTRIGEANRRKPDLDAAWQATLMARYELEHLQGDIQYSLGNYAQAQEYCERALVLARQLNHVEGEGRTCNLLAGIFITLGDFEQAERYWREASRCYQQSGRRTWLAGVNMNRAIAFTESGNPDAALPLLENALQTYSEIQHVRGCAYTTQNLAEAYLALGQLDKADATIWRSIQEEEASLMPANFGVLAEIRLAQNNLSEAETFGLKSIDMAEQNQDPFNAAYAWRTLTQVYRRGKQPKKAAVAAKRARALFEEMGLQHEIEALIEEGNDI